MKTIIAIVLAILVSIAAVITHVVVCIKTSALVLLIAGIFIPFVAIIHGFGYWFSWWA